MGELCNFCDLLSETVNEKLLWACDQGHMTCLKGALKDGADMNFCNEFNITPLMKAADHGDEKLKCLKFLIEAGADVNRRNSFGFTVLHHAALKHASRALKVLIEAGADVNIMTEDGTTPLMCTASDSLTTKSEYTKPAVLLLLAGSKINVSPERKRNYNALESHLLVSARASQKPNQDMCKLLFAAGEEVKETTVDIENESLPDYVLRKDSKLNLQNACRETIRKHMLGVSQVNLLYRIPQLKLPKSLITYLLYNASLDGLVSMVTNIDVPNLSNEEVEEAKRIAGGANDIKVDTKATDVNNDGDADSVGDNNHHDNKTTELNKDVVDENKVLAKADPVDAINRGDNKSADINRDAAEETKVLPDNKLPKNHCNHGNKECCRIC